MQQNNPVQHLDRSYRDPRGVLVHVTGYDREKESPIPGFGGDYTVTVDGLVFSYKRGVRKQLRVQKNRCGYLYVGLQDNLRQKKHTIHQLVARTFILRPAGKLFVNHMDGDKTNNKVSNLEWVTAKENSQHAVSIGNFRKRKVSQFGMNGELIATHKSLSDASRFSGVSVPSIGRVLKGETKTAGNYIWSDKERLSAEEILKATTNSQIKPVIKMTMDGKVLALFPSLAKAAEISGLKKCAIGHACRGINKSSGGFKWAFSEVGELEVSE